MNKTIQLNPEYLTTASSAATKKPKAVKPIVPVGNADNVLKHTLLSRIKSHKAHKAIPAVDNKNTSPPADEFSESLDFLRDLSEKRSAELRHKQIQKQKHRLHNTTLKTNKKNTDAFFEVNTELPNELIPKKAIARSVQPVGPDTTVQRRESTTVPTVQRRESTTVRPDTTVQRRESTTVQTTKVQPTITDSAIKNNTIGNNTVGNNTVGNNTVGNNTVGNNTVGNNTVGNNTILPSAPAYGNLKNGKKPTYRQMTQKYRANNDTSHNTISHNTISQNTISQNTISQNTISQNTIMNHNTITHPKKAKRRITKTLKYTLGKHKNGKQISVYIKNDATRSLINDERKNLGNASFADIKSYLRQKNLLKIGSEITPDLAHHLYENAILAGDVTNQSSEHMRHNFFTKDTD
jgi:hypothetical protein